MYRVEFAAFSRSGWTPTLAPLLQVSHHVLSSPSSPTSQLWQLKLGCALGDRISEGQDGSPQRLLHSDLASVLMVRSKQRLYQFSREVGEERAEGVLRAYFMGEGEVELREQEAEWLAATIIIYGIPPRHSLALTPESESLSLSLACRGEQVSDRLSSHLSRAAGEDGVAACLIFCHPPSPPTDEVQTPPVPQSPVPSILPRWLSDC